MPKWLKVTLVVIACLIGLFCGLLSMRRDWITPRPGIRLTPSRPILKAEDVQPGSAFDLFARAVDFSGIDATIPDEELDLMDIQPWSDNIFTGTVAVLSNCQSNIALARLAVRVGDPQVPTCTLFTSRLPYVAPTRNMARILKASALRKASTGDFEGAFCDLELAIRMADIISRGGVVINRLVDIACTGIACGTMTRLADQYEIPATVIKQAIRTLEEIEENLEPWAEMYRHEYLYTEGSIDEIYSGKISWSDMFGNDERIMSLLMGFGRLFGSTPETIRTDFQHCYSHMIYIADHPSDKKAREDFLAIFSDEDSILKILMRNDPVGYILAQMVLPAVDAANTRHLRRLFQLRGTRVFLAVSQYRNEHGVLPASLKELVPAYLPALPEDPFDRNPVRYKTDSDSLWRIYSVSEDGKDDGGDCGTFGGLSNGPDLVISNIVITVAVTNTIGKETRARIQELE